MLAHRATADVALLQLDAPAEGKSAGGARRAEDSRSWSAAVSPSPASASPCAATARAAAPSASPAWSRPASRARCKSAWSIRSGQGTRDGLGACTGDSGGAGVRGQADGPRHHRRRQLVDRTERQRRLRRHDRRHAADAVPRLDFAERRGRWAEACKVPLSACGERGEASNARPPCWRRRVVEHDQAVDGDAESCC